jgi:hypothetical protein
MRRHGDIVKVTPKTRVQLLNPVASRFAALLPLGHIIACAGCGVDPIA